MQWQIIVSCGAKQEIPHLIFRGGVSVEGNTACSVLAQQ